MARRETKHFKALYFDLRVKDLEQHYSKTNPRGANHDLMQLFGDIVLEPDMNK